MGVNNPLMYLGRVSNLTDLFNYILLNHFVVGVFFFFFF